MSKPDTSFKWHTRFIQLAHHISKWSRDPSAKVGAVIVGPDREILSTGFNGFPRGVDDIPDKRYERPDKYSWTEHAERNAIYNAARHGVSLKGCTMYMNWEPLPCPDCARAVIQSGISRVVGPDIPFKRKAPSKNQIDWKESFSFTKKMFEEAGIEVLIDREITELV